jgi:hypothetical protein
LLPTDALLAMYYFGLGFVALLGWAAIAQDLNSPFDEVRRATWNRISAVLAVAGLVQPALAFIARDIARQAARDDEEDRRPSSRFLTLANTCAVGSLAVAAVVIAVASG